MRTYFLRIVITTIFLSGSMPAMFSQDSDEKIKWRSFEDAIALNKENSRKIFIDVYTDWCGWCKRMDKSTFADPEIARYMNEKFYAVKLNAETKDTINYRGTAYVNPQPSRKRSSHQLAIALLRGKMSYPSYVVLDENNKPFTALSGYMAVDRFAPIILFLGENVHLDTTFEGDKWKAFLKEYNQNK